MADVVLNEDSLALLYSDGLTEATDAEGQELGVEGLEALLDDVVAVSAQEAAECLLSAVEHFGGDDQDRDDRTLVLLKTLPRDS